MKAVQRHCLKWVPYLQMMSIRCTAHQGVKRKEKLLMEPWAGQNKLSAIVAMSSVPLLVRSQWLLALNG